MVNSNYSIHDTNTNDKNDTSMVTQISRLVGGKRGFKTNKYASSLRDFMLWFKAKVYPSLLESADKYHKVRAPAVCFERESIQH